jgi:hypothetical protein
MNAVTGGVKGRVRDVDCVLAEQGTGAEENESRAGEYAGRVEWP